MKKILCILIVLFATAVSLIISESNKFESVDNLLAQNVEALTQGESITDHYWCCGNIDVCVDGDNLKIKGKLQSEPCK